MSKNVALKNMTLGVKNAAKAKQPASVPSSHRAKEKQKKVQKVLAPVNLKAAPPVMNGKGGTSQRSRIKPAKINDPAKMDKRLKNVSPWYQSLNDPVHGAGARIPDLVGINTATFQTVQTVSVSTNAAGMNGLLLRSPYVADGTANEGPIFTLTSTSSALSCAWNGTPGAPVELAAGDTIRSVARAHRVVSGCVFAEYEGATLNDQGDVTCFVSPYSDQTLAPFPLSSVQAQYASTVIPVNKARTKPVKASWYPVSMDDNVYSSFVSPTAGTYSQAEGFVPVWGLGMIHSGLNTTTVVKYTIALNWEFIPLYNTVDYISASPSPIDPIEEQMVEQWVQSDFVATGFTTNRIVDTAPGSQKTEAASQGMTAESGFGMLGSLMKELLPILVTMA